MGRRQCKQCGRCCQNGGPALHGDDLPLVGTSLALDDLLCVRVGEMSLHPVTGRAEPAAWEFIKVAGRAGSWQCRFLTDDLVCALHPDKPLECRVLECWQSQPLLDLLGHDLLNRSHLLPDEPRLAAMIDEHDRQCACALLGPYLEGKRLPDDFLQELLHRDMLIRQEAAALFSLSAAREMLYFGRPLFMSLQGAGWRVW